MYRIQDAAVRDCAYRIYICRCDPDLNSIADKRDVQVPSRA